MKTLVVIPARMGSSRFPGKPLKNINGFPMIGHVFNNSKSDEWDTVVATCDKAIFDFIKSINGEVIMTSKKHKRACDRAAEALRKFEKKLKRNYKIIVMVQGDEPMIDTKMIKLSLDTLQKSKNIDVVNLYSDIKNKKELTNQNIVKVLYTKNKEANFFLRKANVNYFLRKNEFIGKQVCVIPFRKKALINFLKLKPTPLEEADSIDMFRLIENNIKIKLGKCHKQTYCVDVKSDIKLVEKHLKN
jgi:3-deoxy-manno-octulosonate cytidylyltransferase (CMP-KDO synthetase)